MRVSPLTVIGGIAVGLNGAHAHGYEGIPCRIAEQPPVTELGEDEMARLVGAPQLRRAAISIQQRPGRRLEWGGLRILASEAHTAENGQDGSQKYRNPELFHVRGPVRLPSPIRFAKRIDSFLVRSARF